MKVPQADDKLEEARFFLHHLQEEGRRAAGSHWKPFEHYLSAFLSAGRSVTFALQKEAKDAYDVWFPKWVHALDEEDRHLLRFMNEQRVSEVKRGGAVTYKEKKLVPGELVPGVMVFRTHYEPSEVQKEKQVKAGLPPSRLGVWVAKPEYYFKIGDGFAEVIAVCGHYVALLERLLHEFEHALEDPAPS